MPLYEVKVEQVSTVYYDIEAETEEEARANFTEGFMSAEFVEREEIISVSYDEPFDDESDPFDENFEEEDE
jgi:hypothetical protein